MMNLGRYTSKMIQVSRRTAAEGREMLNVKKKKKKKKKKRAKKGKKKKKKKKKKKQKKNEQCIEKAL
jgi:hypothetical protein